MAAGSSRSVVLEYMLELYISSENEAFKFMDGPNDLKDDGGMIGLDQPFD